MIWIIGLYLLVGFGLALAITARVAKPSDSFWLVCFGVVVVTLTWPGWVIWWLLTTLV